MILDHPRMSARVDVRVNLPNDRRHSRIYVPDVSFREAIALTREAQANDTKHEYHVKDRRK